MEEARAAIPSAGIDLRALLQPFRSRVPVDRRPEFIALLKQVGTQDQVTWKIFPKESSGAAAGDANVSPSPSPPKHEQTNPPGQQSYPTLEEVRAAVPDDGIELKPFIKKFRGRISLDNSKEFFRLVKKAAKQDPTTKLLIPTISLDAAARDAAARAAASYFFPPAPSPSHRPVSFPSFEEIRFAIPPTGVNLYHLFETFFPRCGDYAQRVELARAVGRVAWLHYEEKKLYLRDELDWSKAYGVGWAEFVVQDLADGREGWIAAGRPRD